MPTNEHEKDEHSGEIIACPQCLGIGFIKSQLCPKCGNINTASVYLKVENSFLFYRFKTFSPWEVAKRRLTLQIDYVLNFVLFITGALGFLLFGFYVYSRFKTGEFTLPLGVFSQNFWMINSLLLRAFLISFLLDQYLVYRLLWKQEQEQYVLKKSYHLGYQPEDEAAKKRRKKQSNMVDLTDAYTLEAQRVIEETYLLALNHHYKDVTALHLLSVLIAHSKSHVILWRLGINPGTLMGKLKRGLEGMLFKQSKEPVHPLYFSPDLKEVVLQAYYEVYHRGGGGKVDVLDLWIPLARIESYAKEILYDLAVEDYKIRHVVQWANLERELSRQQFQRRHQSRFKSKHGMNRAYTAVQTPTLNAYSRDLTLMARVGALAPSLGHEAQLEKLYSILQGGALGVLLVGRPGTGKESMVEEVAQQMAAESVPEVLQDKRLVSIDVASIIAGGDTSQSAERLYKALYEAAHSGNIILFIKDIHHLVGLSLQGDTGKGVIGIDQVLSQAMDRGGFLVIGTTDFKNYTRYLEGSALGQKMMRITINEPDPLETVLMLEARVPYIEGKHHVYFTYQSLEHTVALTNKLIHEGNQPEKTLDVLQEVASFVLTKKGKNALITKNDVDDVMSKKVNMPLTNISQEDSVRLMHLEDDIHKEYINQDYAVKQVASALRRARAEIRDESRPIANFLFVGPTGVGKTELAKRIAELYFGAETNMIRIDMSEFQGVASIERLIGTIESPGLLTAPVRNNPYSILLLDELEKAHPNILNLFLQIMDDGRLTSAEGDLIDFTNLIIVATSNAGTGILQQKLQEGQTVDEIREEFIKKDLLEFFRPEFVNRFDDVIIFQPLSPEDIENVARLILQDVAGRLQKKGIALKVTTDALKEIASRGYDPLYGARPLRRAIQDHVQNALANFLIKGEISRRDTVILEKGGEIRIQKAPEL